MYRPPRKQFNFSLDQDLKEALAWKAHQLRTTQTDVLRRYILSVKEERDAFLRAMIKEIKKRK